MLDIDPADLATVRAILARHVPELEVRVIGSRAKGGARKFSDLDLVLMTERPLALDRLADLREEFSESDLPFLVDLIDWAATAPGFRRIIAHADEVIPRPATG